MVVPLGRAVQGQDGKVMEHIKVPKGTLVNIRKSLYTHLSCHSLT